MTGLNLYVDHELRSDLTNSLRVRAQAARATVVTSGERITTVRDVANDAALDNGVWVIANGRSVTSSGTTTAPDVVMSVADRPSGAVSRPGHQLLFVEPVLTHGVQVGAVVVATGTDGIHRAAVLTLIGSVVVGGLLLAGMYIVLLLTVARALRPVADMTSQAADWSIGDPGRRFGDTQRFLELSSLAHTLDALLDRVAAVLRHEQSLTGDLSHELRTPLARIKAESELLVDAEGRADQHAIEGIRDSTARMERIIDTLLTSARAENAADQGRCSVAAAIAAELEPLHRNDIQIEVDIHPADLHAGVDLDVCERIVAPIIENAARFADQSMTIRGRSVGGRVAVEISNDGPALPPDSIESVFRPGTHWPDPSGHDGTGLGLALSRRLARAADGDVHITAHDPVTFIVELPS
jgi:signal transduction histidine kinase